MWRTEEVLYVSVACVSCYIACYLRSWPPSYAVSFWSWSTELCDPSQPNWSKCCASYASLTPAARHVSDPERTVDMSDCLQSTPRRPTSPISKDSDPYYDGTEYCLEVSQGCRWHTWSKKPVPRGLHAATGRGDLSENDPLAEPAAIPDNGLLPAHQTASERIFAHRIPNFWHTTLHTQRHCTAHAASMNRGVRTMRLRSVSLFSAGAHTGRWRSSALWGHSTHRSTPFSSSREMSPSIYRSFQRSPKMWGSMLRECHSP
jgi:hypothetical protein